ncbi:MAG: flavodoxin family protein, partial [Candidatus Hodarchaeota archaeon]
KEGNVDLLVTQVLKGAESQGAETQKIYLNDLNIKPCQSCGVDPRPEFCIYEDDMKIIYGILESSDLIVLGSPVYFDTVSAQTKLMIDRCNCLTPYVKDQTGRYGFERRLDKRKKGIFIAVAGTEQEFNTILTSIRGFFEWANIELIDTILYAHDDSELGGVGKNRQRMAEAFEIGVRATEYESN